MAFIRAVIQDETGNQVGEAVDFPVNVLPPPEDERFVFLRFVDAYGDTVFNRLQIPAVIEELLVVKAGSNNQDERALIDKIVMLLRLGQEQPHLYVKFIGD